MSEENGREFRPVMFFGGLGAAVGAYVVATQSGLPQPAAATAAVTALCAVWWITEPIPIPVTSLVPFAVFPVMGIMDESAVGRSMGHPMILLLLGGWLLSTAMERSGVHRRLAVGMVRIVGGGGKRLVLGFMIATAFLSMWISNTATTLMVLPVALAVLGQSGDRRLDVALILGVAYAASIGGMGTPVGTPPNVIFMGAYEAATGRELGFLAWMKVGVPIVVIFTPVAWWVLTRRLPSGMPGVELPAPGPWRKVEWRVLLVFASTAVAWVTRSEPAGGWAGLIGRDGVGDGTVALAAVIVMFIVPDGEGGRLLDWPTANRIPWGLLLLFAGGLAVADAFQTSGLATSLGGALQSLHALPRPLMLVLLCLGVTLLSEVASNTAIAALLMPVAAAAAGALGVDPILLMLPAALAASLGFMLPVATAPNAIAFGTGRVTTREMARYGLALDLLGVAVITVAVLFLL